MFKKLFCLGTLVSFSILIGGDGEEFTVFENSGLASIGPCRTMDPVENQIRRKAANTILEIYDVLNERGRFPVYFHVGRGFYKQEDFSLPDSWQEVQYFSGSLQKAILPKPGYAFESCLNAIRECSDQLVLDCTTAGEIAKISIINALFSAECTDEFTHGDAFLLAQRMWSFLYCDMRDASDLEDVQVGDYFYILGHPNYNEKHLLGYARGETLYCVGFKKRNAVFLGFGSFFADGPKTVEQIQQSLAEAYMLGENNQKKYSVGVERALKQIRDQPFSHRKLDIQKIKRSLM